MNRTMTLGLALASLVAFGFALPAAAYAEPAGGRALVLRKDEGDWRLRRPRAAGVQPASASSLIVKVSPELGGSPNFFMAYEEIAPGGEIPAHRHRSYDEILFVHRGEGLASLGERAAPVAEGATIYIPAATRVGLRNTGKSPLQVVFIFPHPEKVAAYYADLTVRKGEAAEPMTAEDLRALREKHRDHIEFE
ncbi:cupin domain-containing protein [Phenylobacterium sp.]|uniref:cupin domain-containing protein n=1 Tax=Phenylobacterium sp. TaxID=1871053 RepID=UPI002ED96BD5